MKFLVNRVKSSIWTAEEIQGCEVIVDNLKTLVKDNFISKSGNECFCFEFTIAEIDSEGYTI